MTSKAFELYRELVADLGSQRGGTVPYGDIAFFQDIKRNMPAMFHCKEMQGSDNHRVKILVVYVDMGKKKKEGDNL